MLPVPVSARDELTRSASSPGEIWMTPLNGLSDDREEIAEPGYGTVFPAEQESSR